MQRFVGWRVRLAGALGVLWAGGVRAAEPVSDPIKKYVVLGLVALCLIGIMVVVGLAIWDGIRPEKGAGK